MFREDYSLILDFMPTGYSTSFKKEPVAQAMGDSFFTLLELITKEGVSLRLRDRVYIGPEVREHVNSVRGRLDYNDLTTTAKNELPGAIEQVIRANEQKYVDFYNKAGAVTVRQHTLEMLPNVGKKHLMAILEAREKKPFESFVDVKERVKLLPDPVKLLTDRIIEELKGTTKNHLFARPPQREDFDRRY